MARKFLYFVAICIVLVIVGLVVLRIWSKELTELAFVPTTEFVEQEALEANAYQDPAMWFSRPGIGLDDPARWQPATRGAGRTTLSPSENGATPAFATFFIHPTSYLERTQWNAPLDDKTSQDLARLYIKGMASAFNQASEIWAPKYRQAAFGAFLSDSGDATKAIDAAYADVKMAFEFFLATVGDDTPVVLAGHSQGALHLQRLLHEEIAGKPVAERVAVVYAIGWPISIEHDLPSLGFPACANEGQSGCIMSWSSYAEPADPSAVMESYANSTGFDGQLRGDSVILCTNPLTGGIGGTAPASSNLGTLVPDGDLANGELVPGAVPARCDERGLLLIGDPPQMGNAALPGNNYHVYDIPLFWANIQRGVVERVRAWQAQP